MVKKVLVVMMMMMIVCCRLLDRVDLVVVCGTHIPRRDEKCPTGHRSARVRDVPGHTWLDHKCSTRFLFAFFFYYYYYCGLLLDYDRLLHLMLVSFVSVASRNCTCS